ncbi:MAG: zeta toxin family protein [Chloroflexi bacterium]|nr:zeta toxin family protein [Chloroflexota bacterium]
MVILIIAGPNGAGKTTFAREYLLNEADFTTFVNADLIAAGLNPMQPEQEAVAAGRMMLAMIRRYSNEGRSFALETTLSGRTYASMIPRWQERGYQVSLVFLSLSSPEVAIERVRQRVQDGGHNIPEDVIRRRFEAGRRNFDTIYRPLVNQWALYDNSGDSPMLLIEGENL